MMEKEEYGLCGERQDEAKLDCARQGLGVEVL